MKFSIVLGTVALSYQAYASPAMEGRATEYCCMQFDDTTSSTTPHYAYIPYNGKGITHAFTPSQGCQIDVSQGATRPSQGGCKDWVVVYTCPTFYTVNGAARDASLCKK
ncbi:hypothetical protein E4U34_008234 [Claviceps purpurea]|nr:hypothetical protein E4U11_008190 [Claviceps purpurea]KAG6166723.1 hypothetical protein E4U27_008139 [Claviceps purpurea]KAG6206583.1 hypothetical protein E4U34_008234 [Claviceps purpurea]KAG6269705.1 hypothetical protein E4U47_004030 [Claviceps purpurea]KAG6280927.1 hypothetical protein E4U46_000457 [Claviceps purpurea]